MYIKVLANVTHDLKSPINGILTYIEILESNL